MIPAFCINRPVATILLAIGLVLAGLAGYRLLPVAALPKVDFPTINVTATLSGASPETMATSVSTPLIKQFETIPGISEISATNSLGNSSVVLQFDLNRDIDAAAADVQAAISRASRQLPSNMTSDRAIARPIQPTRRYCSWPSTAMKCRVVRWIRLPKISFPRCCRH